MILIKEAKFQIARSLAGSFNGYLETGNYRGSLKIVKVIPLHKGGSSLFQVSSFQVYLTIRKNTQEGHSEKTTRSSRSTAPLWQYFYTYGGKLNLKK